MRTVACCVLVGSLAFVAPRQEQEPSIAEELEALIEKTNELEGFRAAYRLHTEGEQEGGKQATLELLFAAPDRAGARAEGDGKRFETYISGRTFRVHTAEDEAWQTFELLPSEAERVFLESFPVSYALDSGLCFSIEVRSGMGARVVWQPIGRPCVLDWLGKMKGDVEHVAREGEQLVWVGDGFRFAVSRKTGFPEEVRVERDDGDGLATLTEFEETTGDAASFSIPDEAWAARTDPKTQLQWLQSMRLLLRTFAYQRVMHLVDEGELEWDARTRELWTGFVDTYYREAVAADYEAWTTQQKGAFEKLAQTLHEQEKDTPEKRKQLAQDLIGLRQKVEESFARAREKYFDGMPAIRSGANGTREGLLKVEREAYVRVFEELVAQPLRDFFHAQVDIELEER